MFHNHCCLPWFYLIILPWPWQSQKEKKSITYLATIIPHHFSQIWHLTPCMNSRNSVNRDPGVNKTRRNAQIVCTSLWAVPYKTYCVHRHTRRQTDRQHLVNEEGEGGGTRRRRTPCAAHHLRPVRRLSADPSKTPTGPQSCDPGGLLSRTMGASHFEGEATASSCSASSSLTSGRQTDKHTFWGVRFWKWLSRMFSEGFHRQLGCTAAVMLHKQARWTFRKHITKPSEQVAAPDCTENSI